MEICSFCRLTLLSSRLQSFLHEATSEACEYYFTKSCWGMDLYLCLKWDTVRRHFQSLSERRAPRQSSLSTNWSNPLGFVYLNETLRPRGVCWEKVRNAKYLFFLGLLPLSFCLFFFSLPALQLHDPEILGKHPGSAALLSLAASPPLHWTLWFPAQFL